MPSCWPRRLPSVGTDRAVHAALESLGARRVAALLPYLQPAALRTPLRKAVKAAGVDVDELRAQAAGAAGVELPEPIKLRRMTWWSVAQVVLLVLAATAVINFATTIDWDAVWSDLPMRPGGGSSSASSSPRPPRDAGDASLGSIAADLPFGRVYMKQLATSY